MKPIFAIFTKRQKSSGALSRFVRSGAEKTKYDAWGSEQGRARLLEPEAFEGLSSILWQTAGSERSLRDHYFRHISGCWETVLGQELNPDAASGAKLISLLSPALRMRVLRCLAVGLRTGKEALLKTEFVNARGESISMTMRCKRVRHREAGYGLSGILTFESVHELSVSRGRSGDWGREDSFEYLPVALVRINLERGKWKGNASFRNLQAGENSELLDQVREAVRRVEFSGMRFHNRTLCTKEGKVWQLFLSRCPERNRCGERIIEACLIPAGVHDFGVEELLRSYRKLQDQKIKNEQFMAILAHELRNPLAALNSTFALLWAEQGLDNKVWCREVIERQLAILRRLMDDLLDVSRIELKTIQLRKEPLELAPVIRRVLSSVGPRISERRQNLSIELPEEPIYLYADSIRLEQIFGNLLTNAIKFTGSGGNIRLAARAQEEAVTVEIEDNGAGIPAEMLQEIFELFTRAGHSEDRVKGLGIGLTVVRKLVDLHGGQVSAFSCGTGTGSKFVVTLPRIKRVPKRLEQVRKRIECKHEGSVLIVEDNQDAAQALALLLQSSGYQTSIALNGFQALTQARREPVDIMLIDVDLPDINGFSVIKQLRDENLLRNVRVICLSGYSRSEDEKQSRALGVFSYLIKPVNFSDLLALLPSNTSRTAVG